MKGAIDMKKLKKLIAVIMIIALMIPCTAFAATDSTAKKKLSDVNGKITVTKTYTYNGKTQTPEIKVTATVNGKAVTLEAGKDYTIKADGAGKAAGTYTIKIYGQGNYTGTLTKKYTIKQKAQPVKVSSKYKTVAAKTFKKKSKSYKITTSGVKEKGKVTYKTSSKKITVKNGKITLKKGIKKGTYKVTVTVAATDNYKKTTKTLTIKVK